MTFTDICNRNWNRTKSFKSLWNFYRSSSPEPSLWNKNLDRTIKLIQLDFLLYCYIRRADMKTESEIPVSSYTALYAHACHNQGLRKVSRRPHASAANAPFYKILSWPTTWKLKTEQTKKKSPANQNVAQINTCLSYLLINVVTQLDPCHSNLFAEYVGALAKHEFWIRIND